MPTSCVGALAKSRDVLLDSSSLISLDLVNARNAVIMEIVVGLFLRILALVSICEVLEPCSVHLVVIFMLFSRISPFKHHLGGTGVHSRHGNWNTSVYCIVCVCGESLSPFNHISLLMSYTSFQ